MAEFCNMPFIVSLHYAFTTKKYTALVMEYVEAGSLETMVKVRIMYNTQYLTSNHLILPPTLSEVDQKRT